MLRSLRLPSIKTLLGVVCLATFSGTCHSCAGRFGWRFWVPSSSARLARCLSSNRTRGAKWPAYAETHGFNRVKQQFVLIVIALTLTACRPPQDPTGGCGQGQHCDTAVNVCVADT